MKKNHKKKYLALALCLVLLSIAVASGSLAWFTAVDQVTNVFTVGSISVEQHETGKNGEAFVQNQLLMPVLGEGNVENDPYFIPKLVTVENTGENPAYLRTWIALPTQLDGILCHLVNEDSTVWKWVSKITVKIEGDDYTVWCYVYQKPLAVSQTTEPLLKGVYLDAAVEIQDNPATDSKNLEFCKIAAGKPVFSGFEVLTGSGELLDGKVIDLLIATQAVQTEGFTAPEEALNTTFGDPGSPSSAPSFQIP